MLGTVEAKNRMDGTVISDAVNLASRLEHLTKEYGVSLLISHQTLARLHNPTEYSPRFIGQVKVKGKLKAVGVFEVFDGDEPEIKERKLATKTLFEEGLKVERLKVEGSHEYAIRALFSGKADDAVKAGIAMLQNLTEHNQHRANSGNAPIQVGIGINTGSLMLGTVGGKNWMDGTVISDAVNLAARLERLTKEYGVSLLISHQTLGRLHNPTDYSTRFIEQVKVRGMYTFPLSSFLFSFFRWNRNLSDFYP